MHHVKIPRNKGATFMELMISVAIVGIIYFGIMGLVSLSSKSMWSLGGSLDLTGQSSEAMQFISTDFKYAKASSMGNLAENPGFEYPLSLEASPLQGWEGGVGAGYFVQRTGPAGEDVKGGIRSIELNSFSATTSYFSNVINIPDTKSYVVSGWAKGTTDFGLVQGDKTDFMVPITIPNSYNYWVHLTTAPTLNAGQQVSLKLNSPGSGGWILSLNGGSNTLISDMCVYKDKLYSGHLFTGDLYVFDGSVWNIAKNFSKYVNGLCVYDDGSGEQLYVSWGPGVGFGGMYRYDGTNWVAFPVPANMYFRKMCSFGGKLYLICFDKNVVPAKWKIFAYDPVMGGWLQKFELIDSNESFSESRFYVYNGKIYIGSGRWFGDGAVYSSFDGNTWNTEFVIPNSRGVRSWCEFNGKLYCGVDGTFKARIYTFDGSNWTLVYTFPLDYKDGPALCVWSGQLYAGTGACEGGGPYFNYGKIFVRGANDSIWTEVWDSGHVGINALITYKDKLYAGCGEKFSGANSAKTYVYYTGSYFDDVSISPEEVIFNDSTIVNGVDNVYRYEICKSNSDGDINRFKLHRLRYEPITDRKNPAWPGKLYRERYDNATWQPVGLQSDGAICENVEQLRIFNHNQESFDVELTLRKELHKGKEKQYIIHTTITPDVP